MLLLLLTGCEVVEPLLWEVRDDPDQVTLSGYVYNGPFPEADALVITASEGAVTALDPIDRERVIYEGVELYPETYPGYWALAFEPEQDFLLHIDGGPDHYPALWLGQAPLGNGLLPSSAEAGEDVRAGLFGWPKEVVDGLFASVAEAEGVALEALDEGEVVHLWGGPLEPEAVRGDLLAVRGGDGEPATVFAYSVDENGGLALTTSGPVHYFFAFNLAPGEVTVSYDGGAEASYLAEGGEIVSPWFYVGL